MDILQLSASLFYNQLSLDTLFWNFMHASFLGEISEPFLRDEHLDLREISREPFHKRSEFYLRHVWK